MRCSHRTGVLPRQTPPHEDQRSRLIDQLTVPAVDPGLEVRRLPAVTGTLALTVCSGGFEMDSGGRVTAKTGTLWALARRGRELELTP
jgi:hypothetical protein